MELISRFSQAVTEAQPCRSESRCPSPIMSLSSHACSHEQHPDTCTGLPLAPVETLERFHARVSRDIALNVSFIQTPLSICVKIYIVLANHVGHSLAKLAYRKRKRKREKEKGVQSKDGGPSRSSSSACFSRPALPFINRRLVSVKGQRLPFPLLRTNDSLDEILTGKLCPLVRPLRHPGLNGAEILACPTSVRRILRGSFADRCNFTDVISLW